MEGVATYRMGVMRIRCCTCGDMKTISVTRQPEFSFEFYPVIKEAGWFPALDLNYGRTLCFCSEQCYKKQLTKKGIIRKRLIHVEKENQKTSKQFGGDNICV